MRKAGAFLLLLIGMTVLTFAQEDDSDVPIFDDWDIYVSDLYATGDQAFIISLGTVFPTVFLNNGNIINHNLNPPVGGTGSLSYNYFLNLNFFLGGEIGGIFMPTLGNNLLYIIPLGLRAGYQFYFWRFEFPVNLTVGMTWHRYLNLSYYGFFFMFVGAVYYRFNSDWSFGLTTNWCWFPQWTSERSRNVDGNFVELVLSARYHF
jgi:hypothetical protein